LNKVRVFIYWKYDFFEQTLTKKIFFYLINFIEQCFYWAKQSHNFEKKHI